MRHRVHIFPGKGIFWIIILVFVFGGFGKSGFPGAILPFIIIWFVGSMLSGLFRADYRPHRARRRNRWTTPVQPQTGPTMTRPAVPSAPRPVQSPVRSMADVPSRCKACGGPANETTLEWRVNKPHCGYCGTGLIG